MAWDLINYNLRDIVVAAAASVIVVLLLQIGVLYRSNNHKAKTIGLLQQLKDSNALILQDQHHLIRDQQQLIRDQPQLLEDHRQLLEGQRQFINEDVSIIQNLRHDISKLQQLMGGSNRMLIRQSEGHVSVKAMFEYGRHAMPRRRHSNNAETVSDDRDCSICHEPYVAGEQKTQLPCMHTFHAECIATWFEELFNCPQCRRKSVWVMQLEGDHAVSNTV